MFLSLTMKVVQKEISLTTRKRYDFVKITGRVVEIVKNSKLKNGIVSINSLHTTAGVIIQENDETIFKDMMNTFERILPLKERYNHLEEDNENAIAHQITTIIGNSVSVPVVNGELRLGMYQNIFFIELDKARNRTVSVTVIGE